jgi:1,4-alpha-glucan branching enzyme
MKNFVLLTVLFSICLCSTVSAQNAVPQKPPKQTPPNQTEARKAPDWVNNGTMYQVQPRAFTKEGTLKAATEKLPKLAELGITIVYLFPIFLADDDPRQDYWSPRQ